MPAYNAAKTIEATVKDIPSYCYDSIIVVDDKYVMNVKCKMWDKKQEVVDILDLLKTEDVKMEAKSLYVVYEKYASKRKTPFVVSKRYFEKIAKEYLGVHLDNDGLISPKWSEH